MTKGLLEGSAQPCGCDPGCKYADPVSRMVHWHTCPDWPTCAYGKSQVAAKLTGVEIPKSLNPTKGTYFADAVSQPAPYSDKSQQGDMRAADAPYIEAHAAKMEGIKDSGLRQKYASGAMRDPSTGKIKWSRVTFGPMLRRWAQHLTTAEAKYPDVAPGVPNFTLIESKEELLRYKESALRHFMSWFFDESDEDHASAVFFNVNGVEIIKAKQKGQPIDGIKFTPKPDAVPTTAAYVVVEKSRCNASIIESATRPANFYCSLSKFHKGGHKAHANHDLNGDIMASWRNDL